MILIDTSARDPAMSWLVRSSIGCETETNVPGTLTSTGGALLAATADQDHPGLGAREMPRGSFTGAPASGKNPSVISGKPKVAASLAMRRTGLMRICSLTRAPRSCSRCCD